MVVEAIRLFIILAFTAIGLQLAPEILDVTSDGAAENARLIGAIVGAGVGYVAGGIAGRLTRSGIHHAPDRVAAELSGAELFAGGFGMPLGVIVGGLLAIPILVFIPDPLSFPLAGLLLFVIAATSARLFAARSDDLMGAVGLRSRGPLVSRAMEEGGHAYLIDSSAAIDGRILELVRSGLVEGRTWLPTAVLDEMQGLADASNRATRRRGRRGLDVVGALQDELRVEVAVVEETMPQLEHVDVKLLALAERANARLITTDHNLAKAAELRAIKVLNPNVVAEAVKSTVEVGARVKLPISRKGSEPGQGVAYLDDGTMIVVEGAADRLGEELDIEITSRHVHRSAECCSGAWPHNITPMNMWGIVVAAGTGTRLGRSKHDLELGGRQLWQWARQTLIDGGAMGVVVVGPVDGGVAGGNRRQDSVANGLAVVPDDATVIAVHDAARPLASPALVRALCDRLSSDDVHGVVPVVAVRDTIKQMEGDRVGAALDRAKLVAVQTPQVFTASWLRRAHAAVVSEATDDAAMVESIGGTVVAIPGESAALKITYPEDVVLALHHLSERDTT